LIVFPAKESINSEYLLELLNQGCDFGLEKTDSLPLSQSPKLFDLATM
jgi:hypothetical protein